MINDERELDARHVKSAYRAMQILEILHASRQGLRLRDLAQLAGAPMSSIDYVLKTMVRTGHLEYRHDSKTYRLSHRVGLLGHWNDSSLMRDGPLIRLMKELRDECGHNVALTTRNGHYAQLIHIEYGDEDFVVAGVSSHLLKSAAGVALLSLLPDEEIAVIVRRYNAGRSQLQDLVDLAAARTRVDAARADGFIADRNSAGWAVAIPQGLREGHLLTLVIGSQRPDSWPGAQALFEAQRRLADKWLA